MGWTVPLKSKPNQHSFNSREQNKDFKGKCRKASSKQICFNKTMRFAIKVKKKECSENVYPALWDVSVQLREDTSCLNLIGLNGNQLSLLTLQNLNQSSSPTDTKDNQTDTHTGFPSRACCVSHCKLKSSLLAARSLSFPTPSSSRISQGKKKVIKQRKPLKFCLCGSCCWIL